MSVLEKIFKRAKLKACVYKLSLDGVVTVVVSVPGVEGVTGADRAVERSASPSKRTFDGVACFNCEKVP